MRCPKSSAARQRAGSVPVEILLVWADTVPPEPIEWHWKGFLAAGKLSLLAGDPGVGKSTIPSEVTARYTTGAPFPGSTERRPPKRCWSPLLRMPPRTPKSRG